MATPPPAKAPAGHASRGWRQGCRSVHRGHHRPAVRGLDLTPCAFGDVQDSAGLPVANMPPSARCRGQAGVTARQQLPTPRSHQHRAARASTSRSRGPPRSSARPEPRNSARRAARRTGAPAPWRPGCGHPSRRQPHDIKCADTRLPCPARPPALPSSLPSLASARDRPRP